MKTKILVVGASGNFGGAAARALVAHGHEVRVLARTDGRSVDIAGAEVVHGDARVEADLYAATEGVDVVVYGLNLPYPDWHKNVEQAALVMAHVAKARGLCVVLPGNVYGLGPDFSAPMTESATRKAPSKKGQIRNRLEATLHDATVEGAQLIIVRAGDFFGPGAFGTSWFDFLTRKAREGGALLNPSRTDCAHAWAYLPDLAETTAQLIARRDALSASEVFHFAGHAVTTSALLAQVRAALGDPERKIRNVPWWAMKLAAPFSAMLREILEMRYLWDEPVLLDDTKLRHFLGTALPHTPLQQAVARTLAAAPQHATAPSKSSASQARTSAPRG